MLISFRIDWFDLLVVQGTLKSLLQHYSLNASILWCSVFFMVQLSHLYMTAGKTIALTIWTFVGKVMSVLFNTQSRFVTASYRTPLQFPSRQWPCIFFFFCLSVALSQVACHLGCLHLNLAPSAQLGCCCRAKGHLLSTADSGSSLGLAQSEPPAGVWASRDASRPLLLLRSHLKLQKSIYLGPALRWAVGVMGG